MESRVPDRLLDALPWMWLGLSALWAIVIFVTDQVGTPLALWVATTLGPLSVLERRKRARKDGETGTSEGSP